MCVSLVQARECEECPGEAWGELAWAFGAGVMARVGVKAHAGCLGEPLGSGAAPLHWVVIHVDAPLWPPSPSPPHPRSPADC
jgi:hypothetical protein